jgi:DNA-directed RNA polymerase specialized sigma subunit
VTRDEARKILRKYYRILEIANDYRLKSNDIIIAVGQTHSAESPQEREIVRRVSMLQDVKVIKIAIERLHEEYQRFIELRFQQDMSLWTIGKKLHASKTAVWRFENECLSAFGRVYQSLVKESKAKDEEYLFNEE